MIRKSSANRAPCLAAVLTFVVAVLSTPTLSAQNLPPPSRTMYKCKVNGTTTYSDMPCLGAEKLEVEPTRGVSKLSGSERIGSDVSRERWREGLAEAVRPITGMDAKQFATFGRCNQLALRDIQLRLFRMRQRFHDLHC
jgi:hypothetical protein